MHDDRSFPTVPALATATGPVPAPDIQPLALGTPRRIGSYALTGVLGSGGMGVVYRATQEGPLRREVALKVIRRGLDTDRLIARFDAERQALARMNHAGIARVFDAGATDDGRPYVVMELVEGIPLTTHCDRQKATIPERLRLFVAVCRAVQHAHQKSVVHRDLKPSNILVTLDHGTASPKVIDFGIAKVVAAADEDARLLTREDQLVGTPEYMSPEQAGVIDADVDTRTDVYALGVVLYELLAGRKPHRFTTGTRDEVQRVLRERSAVRPSTAVGAGLRGRLDREPAPAPDAWAAVAADRRTTPDRLTRTLAGDLDTIVLKAMAYEPARRYASVDQLAEDVERYLSGEPVQARPDSRWYRARKFAARHRYAVAGASVAVAALAVFSVMTAVQSARVARERDRAEQALARAEAVNRFLVGMFEQADPRQTLGTKPTAEEVLQRAATRLEHDLQQAPLVRAQLLQSLADVYKQLGQYDLSERLNVQAIELRRQDAPLVLADSLDALGDVRRYAGRTDAAVAPLEEALALRRAHLGPRHKDVAETTNNLALVRHAQGRYDLAERLHREAVAIWQDTQATEPGDDLVALGLTNLGRSVRAQGRAREAAELFERALAIRRARLAPANPRLATSLYFVALTRVDDGRLSEAKHLLEESLRIRSAALGDSHPQTLQSRVTLAQVHLRLGNLTTAATEADAVTTSGSANPNTWVSVLAAGELVKAEVALQGGRHDEARSALRRASPLVGRAGKEMDPLGPDLDRLARTLASAR